jgi:hypothetical protein
MRIFAAALLFPVFAFAQDEWRFAHPDATLVGTIHPAALLNSPLLASAWTSAGPNDPSAAAMVAMAKGMLGGIKEIRFSLMDNGSPEPDVVAVIDGQFDEAMLAALGQASAKYRRLDAHTILFGNGPSLEKAAARVTQSTPVLQPRVLAGTDLLAAYDMWVSGRIPNLPAGGLNLPDGLKLDVRGVALGLSVHENVEMELALETTSPVAAEALLRTAHEAELSQPQQLRGVLRSFADGNTARFRMNLPQAMAMEALQARSAPLTASAPQPLPPPAKPRRTTVLIQGLDDGPREIPLH